MKYIAIIDFHISREITGKVVITGIWLLTVHLFISLLDLMEDVSGEDQLSFVVQVLTLSIPRMIYELSPMVFLIGTMMALANLAKQHELTAMQVGGVSKLRITSSVVQYSMMFALVIFLWGELAVPMSENYQDKVKNARISSQNAEQVQNGLWFRDHNQFIHVTRFEDESSVGKIEIFHFDVKGKLVKLTSAAGGIVNEDESVLKMYGVKESVIENAELRHQMSEIKDYPIQLELEVIGAHDQDPSRLTMIDLYRAIRFLKANGLNTEFLDLAFWNRLIMPISMFVMALFAVLFTFKNRGGTGTGQLVFVGLISGLLYFAVQQSVGYVAMLNGLQPVIGTFTAFVVFSLGVSAALHRL